MIALSALVVMCFGLYCVFHVCRKWKGHRNMQIHKEIITVIEWLNEPDVNHKDSPIIWSSRARKWHKLKISDEPCAICLEPRTTAELFCRHQYHPKCIGEWLRKSNACPCCRLEDIRGIKVYCDDCRWRYFVCVKTMITN